MHILVEEGEIRVSVKEEQQDTTVQLGGIPTYLRTRSPAVAKHMRGKKFYDVEVEARKG